MDDLDHLLTLGCDWLQDYLKTNHPLPLGDHTLCQDVIPSAAHRTDCIVEMQRFAVR